MSLPVMTLIGLAATAIGSAFSWHSFLDHSVPLLWWVLRSVLYWSTSTVVGKRANDSLRSATCTGARTVYCWEFPERLSIVIRCPNSWWMLLSSILRLGSSFFKSANILGAFCCESTGWLCVADNGSSWTVSQDNLESDLDNGRDIWNECHVNWRTLAGDLTLPTFVLIYLLYSPLEPQLSRKIYLLFGFSYGMVERPGFFTQQSTLEDATDVARNRNADEDGVEERQRDYSKQCK